jgi:hypothetical protein
MKLKKRRKDEERHPIFMERPNWSIQILYPVEKHKNYVDVYQQFGHLHFHLVSPDVDITYFGASGFGGHSSNETGLSDPRRIVLRAVEDRLGKYSKMCSDLWILTTHNLARYRGSDRPESHHRRRFERCTIGSRAQLAL